MDATVSVIIPFYGISYSKRLELAVKSVLFQRRVNIELIIAGLDTATKINNYLILPKCLDKKTSKIVRMGAIINNGIRLANGEFVYISDADILFQNPNYLEKLIQEYLYHCSPLKRPPMRRLFLQDFEWFYSQVSLGGLENTIALLDTSQKYIVKPKNTKRAIRIFPKFENGRQKIFIASENNFQEYISSKENKGLEPRYFSQDRHCGAVFARTNDIIDVGGYHEGFISWGVWDADLQWKLENQIGMKLIPYKDEFIVIHLDHEKRHFSKSKWEHDKELQKKRRTRGVKECIVKDREVYFGRKNER